MSAYYNEIDSYAADWLEALIRDGQIAPGIVDRRSILDVRPSDLRGFKQCHFFAGIGVWSYALRRAGWPDTRPVWTGSCPCQPFSAAGSGGGFDDERHLWPHWHHLIRVCRPAEVFGEQVASKDGLGWLDLVSSDMEGTGYAIGAFDTCSAGSGAPHIRQRLRFVAKQSGASPWQRGERSPASSTIWMEHSESDGRIERWSDPSGRGIAGRRVIGGMADNGDTGSQGGVFGREIEEWGTLDRYLGRDCSVGGLADYDDTGLGGITSSRLYERWDGTGCNEQAEGGSDRALRNDTDGCGEFSGMADYELQQRSGSAASRHVPGGWQQEPTASAGLRSNSWPGPTNGFWRDADWLLCRDGKWRPVEPGTFPLAHGATSRVGRLRAYGNAVDAEATRHFIEAYLDTETIELEPLRDLDTDGHGHLTAFEDLLG